MTKTYCLDTNVLVNDPAAIQAFEDNAVVIPEYVLGELDRLKEGYEERNRSSREAIKLILSLTRQLNLKVTKEQDFKKQQEGGSSFQQLPEIDIPGTPGGKLVLLMDDPKDRVQGESQDDRILGLFYKHRTAFKTPIILVTNDANMAIKALARGFGFQEYRKEQAKVQVQKLPVLDAKILPMQELFSSPGKPVPAPDLLKQTYADGDKNLPIIPGYYIVNCEDGKELLVAIDENGAIRAITNTPSLCNGKINRGIRAKNAEQMAAVDSLMAKDKTLICLLGPAGTGKTLLAIAAALDLVRKANRACEPVSINGGNKEEEVPMTRANKKRIRGMQEEAARGKMRIERQRILIARPMVGMGEEMGFLPGTIHDKMLPWMMPILDNLKLLVGEKQVSEYMEDGTIELQPLTYIRGRSISNAILIVDEAQNTSLLEIKTIITRAGENCRVILTGDPDQIDKNYVGKMSNGLTLAADRMGRTPYTSVIPLTKCERSRMAADAAQLL